MIDDPVVLQSVVNDLVLDKPQQETLLDKMAMAAMCGLLGDRGGSYSPRETVSESGWVFRQRLVRDAYDYAECMLRERHRRLQKQSE